MSNVPPTTSTRSRPRASRVLVDSLLNGFDMGDDEDTKDFLGSIVASGQVPQAEIEELMHLSLMHGVEEWDMLFECAAALRSRNRNPVVETSLVPFLGAILAGQAGQVVQPEEAVPFGNGAEGARKASGRRRKASAPRKRGGLVRGASRFWGDAGELSEGVMPKQRRANELGPVTTGGGHGSSGDGRGAVKGGDRTVATETSPPSVIEDDTTSSNPNTRDERRSDAQKRPLPLSKGTSTSNPEPRGEAGRAVKATGTTRSPFFGTSTSAIETPKEGEAEPSTPATSSKKPRPPRGTVSSLPIPPLSADRFGLIQEELADDPFRLLVAVTFLIRTAGRAAIPVFRQLMERFPGPEALAAAEPAEIIALIRPLGLSAVRCAAIQKYARLWLEKPPTREVRYGVKNYPRQGDGRHVRVKGEFGFEDDDGSPSNNHNSHGGDAVRDARERALGSAWEIAHATQGPYALDSWRIFCRDVLLGRSDHWAGKRDDPGFQPEWMRVLPQDKELRACLRWMWMREGWEWDPLTGERDPLRDEMRQAVDEGRVGYNDRGNLVILDQPTVDQQEMLRSSHSSRALKGRLAVPVGAGKMPLAAKGATARDCPRLFQSQNIELESTSLGSSSRLSIRSATTHENPSSRTTQPKNTQFLHTLST